MLAGLPGQEQSHAQAAQEQASQNTSATPSDSPTPRPDAGGADATASPDGSATTPATRGGTPTVTVLNVQGIISPATSDFVTRGIRDAAEQRAMLIILQMDTPGGLDTSMRSIIRQILASPVPVATFVSPGGARAASAGAFILYASHIAAMTPASNLGAASPVSIGGAAPSGDQPDTKPAGKTAQNPSGDTGQADKANQGKTEGDAARDSDSQRGAPIEGSTSTDTMTRKVTNDAAAYLRSLAQLRGRNAEFAQEAVLQARSLSSSEALEAKVIDLVAKDVPDLLHQLNGREITLDDGRLVTLHTEHADVVYEEPDWRTNVLALIANPQVALVLMMIGVYGLFFELTSPGLGVPGIAGLISLLLGLYAFQLLPVNWAGLGLAVAGLAMMIGEVFLPSFGALGIGGIIAFVFGGLMLMDTGIPAYDLSIPFLIGLAIVTAMFIILTGLMARRAHQQAVVSGREGMLGRKGVVTSIANNTVYAEVDGESWRVRADQRLSPGDEVEVVSMDGLTLQVVLRPSSAMKREPTEGS
ncbi:nodulation protein NfeD [Allopusillimonas ginsengisoli]|nr:nodulation protein NfeD [Allopusillimonas ginsengisoli]